MQKQISCTFGENSYAFYLGWVSRRTKRVRRETRGRGKGQKRDISGSRRRVLPV